MNNYTYYTFPRCRGIDYRRWTLYRETGSNFKVNPLFMVVLPVGILALIWIGMRWIDNIYKKYCWDRISLIVIIVNIALFIFFSDWVKQLLKINQVVLLLMLHGIYMTVCWYVKGWREARGYY